MKPEALLFCPPLSITFHQIQSYHVILAVMSGPDKIKKKKILMHISQKKVCRPPNNYLHGGVRGQGPVCLSLKLENVT